MKVYYVPDELPEVPNVRRWRVPGSIFLAGPTPRRKDVPSWRPEALRLLQKAGFNGSVFVPETADWGWHGDYDGQVYWEWDAMGRAACTLFWVPRELDTLPGFTTNVEFGFLAAFHPGRTVLGAPDHAPKTRYLKTLAREVTQLHESFGQGGRNPPPVQQVGSLEDALKLALIVAQDDQP